MGGGFVWGRMGFGLEFGMWGFLFLMYFFGLMGVGKFEMIVGYLWEMFF